MIFTVFITTQIEIASPPERVREIFLDFPAQPTWLTHNFKSMELADPSKPNLEAGDKLNVVLLSGKAFSPLILENSPKEFRWTGGTPYIFTGVHIFKFEPSKTTPGGTTFVHDEKFTGLLAWRMGEKNKRDFEGVNEDLKRRAESS